MMNDKQIREIFSPLGNDSIGEDEGWDKLQESLEKQTPFRKFGYWKFSFLLSILLVTSIGIYFYFCSNELSTNTTPAVTNNTKKTHKSTNPIPRKKEPSETNTIITQPLTKPTYSNNREKNGEGKNINQKPIEPEITVQTRAPLLQQETTIETEQVVDPQTIVPSITPVAEMTAVTPVKKKGKTKILVIEDTIVQYDTVKIGNKKRKK